MAKQQMMKEEDHGLGINRAVPARVVFKLENTIWAAAKQSVALGISHETFLDLCDAAGDVASLPEEVVA